MYQQRIKCINCGQIATTLAIGLVECSQHETQQVQQREQEDRQQYHGDLSAEDEQDRVEEVVSAVLQEKNVEELHVQSEIRYSLM